jgi:hypothetical protein
MSALRSLLELHGALDQALQESDDPVVTETIDAFLPNASRNPGWYSDIESFFFGDEANPSPTLASALYGFLPDQTSPEQSPIPPPLTVPIQSRLLYGLSAALRVAQLAPPGAVPSLTLNDAQRAKAADVFALLQPPAEPTTETSSVQSPRPNGPGTAAARAVPGDADSLATAAQIFGEFEDELYRFSDYKDFYAFRAFVAKKGWVDPATLTVPLCETAVVTVNGRQAVLVDTVMSSSEVSLNNLKAVVNPFNWHLNYPQFFCGMDPIEINGPHRSDGWRRVLETVGFCLDGSPVKLKTALKYHAGAPGLNEARLDYDLDDPRPSVSDGQVTVDRGFINMWVGNKARQPDQPGVRIRTRKVVHINGLLPYAQALLVCLTGYGTASAEFLLGAANSPSAKGLADYAYYATGVNAQDPPEPAEIVAPAGSPTVPVTPIAEHVATTAVKLWTSSVQSIATGYFNLAGKWTTGTLTGDDVAAYGKAVSESLTAPWTFVDTAIAPRYPVPPPPSANPDPKLRAEEDTTRALLHAVNVIAEDAAYEDKAGTWGLNGWIRTIHNLIDLQVRTYAALLKYGVGNLEHLVYHDDTPRPSEWIIVDPVDFDRALTASVFTRSGLPGQTVAPTDIGFQPAVLPARATKFRIYLKDERYTGANYCGAVTLTNRGPSKVFYHDVVKVTVGL